MTALRLYTGLNCPSLVFASHVAETDSVQPTFRDSRVNELELTDFDIDHRLLDLPGISLVIFTSIGCSSCRWARRELPGLELPIDRVCWVDAENNGGAVQRYQVFHLPAMFVVRDGEFYGALSSRLTVSELSAGLGRLLSLDSDELP